MIIRGKRFWGILIPAFVIIFLLLAHIYQSSRAKLNDECLSCHSDSSLTMQKNNREISLFVDINILSASEHNDLECTECHMGFDKDNIPHKENIQKVNCNSCHKNILRKHTRNKNTKQLKEKYSDCKSCHGTHDVDVNKVSRKQIRNGKNLSFISLSPIKIYQEKI